MSFFIFVLFFLTFQKIPVFAQDNTLGLPTLLCGAPTEVCQIYSTTNQDTERQKYDDCIGVEKCAESFDEFKENPACNHLWVEDPEITAQGKADERARQFIYWVINTSSIDAHPTLLSIWNISRNVAYFLVILVVAIMGIGIIVAQKANFSTSIKVWPTVWKILLILLYITLSAGLVILIVQLSEILMKFFIETLGGRVVFNIDFGGAVSNENSYLRFVRGCRDINIRVQEGVKAELFLLKLTNVTYYVMGTMLLLRKILLWFLLFVAPFLAILAPFVFIRNIGWIWIGVFFQWVFYGPLFALFFGALATIWKFGIPFLFDFSRVGKSIGYIYPTAINILYGGPAQKLGVLNNGNYVDTFAEYVITLIMLWAVTFFPWWLLRIFRDYCCDGIIASKNILLSIYDQLRGGPPTLPGPIPTPQNLTTSLKIPQDIQVRVKLETAEEVKRTTTVEITKALHISANNLADIARYETDKNVRSNANKNLNFLRNPIQAETGRDRQKFMQIRTELFNRAVREDQKAKQILSSLSSSRIEQLQRREELLKSIPQMVPVTKVVAIKVKMPASKVNSVTNSYLTTASANASFVQQAATQTQVATTQVQSVLNSLGQNLSQPVPSIVQKVAESTGLEKEKVVKVISYLSQAVKSQKEVSASVAATEQVKQEEIEKIVENQMPLVAAPEKNVEQTVSVPANVSLEDYEQVKKMWKQQYQKGEVPVAENIKTREAWVENDIVAITNTLNKLLSVDQKLKQEGLDEVGYIIPIFMINNLKGEELLTYLKAKLEAAKSVQEETAATKLVEENVKEKTTEEFVEVAKPKEAEKAKTMEMKEGMTLDEKPNEKKSQ